ncbi:MAG TPA: hypothetical protein DIT13_01765 [Verrucomicrobiales bacterium]|nr:hypothetical protein [Verrucomicrobiales bacterium]
MGPNLARNSGTPNCLWQPPRNEAASTRFGCRVIICADQLEPPEWPHSTQGASLSSGRFDLCAKSSKAVKRALSEPLSGSFHSSQLFAT